MPDAGPLAPPGTLALSRSLGLPLSSPRPPRRGPRTVGGPAPTRPPPRARLVPARESRLARLAVGPPARGPFASRPGRGATEVLGRRRRARPPAGAWVASAAPDPWVHLGAGRAPPRVLREVRGSLSRRGSQSRGPRLADGATRVFFSGSGKIPNPFQSFQKNDFRSKMKGARCGGGP